MFKILSMPPESELFPEMAFAGQLAVLKTGSNAMAWLRKVEVSLAWASVNEGWGRGMQNSGGHRDCGVRTSDCVLKGSSQDYGRRTLPKGSQSVSSRVSGCERPRLCVLKRFDSQLVFRCQVTAPEGIIRFSSAETHQQNSKATVVFYSFFFLKTRYK